MSLEAELAMDERDRNMIELYLFKREAHGPGASAKIVADYYDVKPGYVRDIIAVYDPLEASRIS